MKTIPVRKLAEHQNASNAEGRFTLRKLEDLMAGNDLIHDLHRHDFYFVLVVKKGKGKHTIDFIEYPVQDHSFYLLRPGQVHELKLKKGAVGYLMEFNPSFFEPGKKIRARNFCQLEKALTAKLTLLLDHMFKEDNEKAEGYITIIKANLEIFFTEIVRQSVGLDGKNDVNTYSQTRLEEFLELLEKHFIEHKEVAFYTNAMNMSAFQLNGITKTSLDKSVAEMINDQVILEAKRYLLATPSQVKEIADLLGYEDVSYFSRFFKKHTGHTPEAFRNKSR